MKNIATGDRRSPAAFAAVCPKESRVIATEASSTAMFSHCNRVLSLAKNVFGSTRTVAPAVVAAPPPAALEEPRKALPPSRRAGRHRDIRAQQRRRAGRQLPLPVQHESQGELRRCCCRLLALLLLLPPPPLSRGSRRPLTPIFPPPYTGGPVDVVSRDCLSS